MILKNELLQYTPNIPMYHVYFFTANNTVKKNGELVMGAGNALAAKNLHPNVAKMFGTKVKAHPNKRTHSMWMGEGHLASFQTKEHWRNPSPIHIVKESIMKLAQEAEIHDDLTFHLPMPGVNHGKLSVADVLEWLQALPDNVIVYHKE